MLNYVVILQRENKKHTHFNKKMKKNGTMKEIEF